MKSKVWTATGIRQGQLVLQVVGPDLRITRTYSFVDGKGDSVPVGHRKLRRSIPWGAVPKNIRDSLLAIDNWTKGEILSKEKMSNESTEK